MWVKDYITDKNLFVCPGFSEAARVNLDLLNPASTNQSFSEFTYIHYGYNYLHLGSIYRYTGSQFSHPYEDRWKYSARRDAVVNPAQTIMLADGAAYGGNPFGVMKGHMGICDNVSDCDNNANQTLYPHARHNAAINVLWVDGHADAVKTDGQDPLRDAFKDDALGDRYSIDSKWDLY